MNFYEHILIETSSLDINHKMRNDGEVALTTLRILKVLSQED